MERVALRAFVDDFSSAWNRHDASAMASAFTPNGDLLNTRGQLASGHQEIFELLRAEHTGPMRKTRTQMKLRRLRFLDARTVMADADMTVTGIITPAGDILAPVQMHVAFVGRKMDQGWRYLSVRPYTFLTGF